MKQIQEHTKGKEHTSRFKIPDNFLMSLASTYRPIYQMICREAYLIFFLIILVQDMAYQYKEINNVSFFLRKTMSIIEHNK